MSDSMLVDIYVYEYFYKNHYFKIFSFCSPKNYIIRSILPITFAYVRMPSGSCNYETRIKFMADFLPDRIFQSYKLKLPISSPEQLIKKYISS